METITLQEFKKIQREQNYKHVGLFKTDGAAIVAFNSSGMKPAKRIDEIELRLQSKALPDGIYVIKAKNYISKATPTDDYYIQKGKANLAENKIPLSIAPDVRTYEAALADQTKIIKLETENAALKSEIENLKKTIAEYEAEPEEEEEEEETPTLGENGGAPAWLNTLIQTATPLLDKHYELKQKALEIEEKRLQAQPIPQPAQPQINDAAVNTMFAVLKKWIFSIDDPQMQEQVKNMYREADTLDEFFNDLEENYPDLADNLEETLNAARQ